MSDRSVGTSKKFIVKHINQIPLRSSYAPWGFFVLLKIKSMKKLIIHNLKDCFTVGLSFKDLAEIEAKVLKEPDFTETIITGYGTMRFKYANVSANGTKLLYYNFDPLF